MFRFSQLEWEFLCHCMLEVGNSLLNLGNFLDFQVDSLTVRTVKDYGDFWICIGIMWDDNETLGAGGGDWWFTVVCLVVKLAGGGTVVGNLTCHLCHLGEVGIILIRLTEVVRPTHRVWHLPWVIPQIEEKVDRDVKRNICHIASTVKEQRMTNVTFHAPVSFFFSLVRS